MYHGLGIKSEKMKAFKSYHLKGSSLLYREHIDTMLIDIQGFRL